MSLGLEKPLIDVVLFTKSDCHLCDEARAVLDEASSLFKLNIRTKDIGSRTEWMDLYGEEVPVVFINGKKSFKFRIPPEDLKQKLLRLEMSLIRSGARQSD